MESLSIRQARRLALARAGLLKPPIEGLPRRAAGRGARARKAAHDVIRRFGYLQLDTVSVAGARSHSIVLASRIGGFDAGLGEELLRPGEPLFEYWGHEASWLPMELYPAFEFRRKQFRKHPWWGDLLGEHPDLATSIMERIRRLGPTRSLDLEGQGKGGWWGLKLSKKVVSALWSAGDLAVRQRDRFQRSFDLTERVIPDSLTSRALPRRESLQILLEKALDGHGWATRGTLANTWRLRGLGEPIREALDDLQQEGVIEPCDLWLSASKKVAGFVRRSDLELAHRLDRARPRGERGVLLSPFDPILWDRRRVSRLFGFEQLLEIFKPASDRKYGYYCLPVLAGEKLVARVDLKAHRRRGVLEVASLLYESTGRDDPASTSEARAVEWALDRYADAVGLALSPP